MSEARSDVIEALSPVDRQALLQRAVPRRLGPGHRLYLSGDQRGRAHLVQSGLLKLIANDGGGRETILGLAVPGELIGEIAAVDGLTQPLDAVAATPAEVLGMDASELVEGLGRSPSAGLALARLMARRSRWAYDTAMERTTSQVPARLAGRLLDLADLLGEVQGGGLELDLPLAQTDLGKLAGVSRESTCKTLKSFRDAGLLDYRGRVLRILRPERLAEIRRNCQEFVARPPQGPREIARS